ncbi:Phage shock protein B [Enterobacter ludwigii]|uniref:Phage shock protein B n=2 Tax=Enterobacter ludwigii TaxID=299767 RepID=G8LDQ0_9ENTR|nr:Phage shock protein B [Enterobacter ludwigii]
MRHLSVPPRIVRQGVHMSALFLAIPLTIFVLFVLPIWLWLHYSNRSSRGELSQSEQQRLVQLTEQANKMRERIQALEDILDAEHPNWRDR